MKIVVGSDHRGVKLKARVKDYLQSLGHEVSDVGTNDENPSVDYPDYAYRLAEKVACGEYERGVLVCSSGIGMSMAANRVKGSRAALVQTEEAARLSRSHNNSNVICFGQDMVDPENALKMVKIWLDTPFEGGRHERRVRKLDQYQC